MRKLGLAALVAVGVTSCATPAFAQDQTCPVNEAPYDDIRNVLTDRYKEAPVARMLYGGGVVLEIWATEDGETWTVIGVRTNGCTWVVSDGTSYVPLKPSSDPGPAA